MKLMVQLLIVALLMVFFSAAVLAQTADELREKYGPSEEVYVRRSGYVIRPDVLMTASFGEDGQMWEMVVEPKRVTDAGIDQSKLMSPEEVAEIVDELVREGQRGRRGRAISFRSSCVEVDSEDYERVSIYRYWACNLKGARGIVSVKIVWKKQQCHRSVEKAKILLSRCYRMG
jgi:hypothetical protein